MSVAGWTGTVIGAVAAVAAVIIGLGGSDPYGASLVLGVAALLAAGCLASPVLGLLALVSALSLSPGATTWSLPWVALPAGAAIGLTARAVEPALRGLTHLRTRWVAGLVLCLAIAGAMLLPDHQALLMAADGQVVQWLAELRDPETGMRLAGTIPGFVPHNVPLHGAADPLIVLALLAGLAVVSARAYGDPRVSRWAWALVGASGLVALVMGVLGLGELLVGGRLIPGDSEALRSALSLGYGPSVGRLVVPDEAWLAPWSRPLVDTIRLLLGAIAALVAWQALRAQQSSQEGLAGRSVRPVAGVTLPIAMAAAVVAAILAPTSTIQLGMAAGTLALAGALVGAAEPTRRHATAWLVIAGMACLVLTWLLPLSGWVT